MSPRASFLALRWYLRELTGASAYDRYVEAHAGGPTPLSRREFERARAQRRDERPDARCC
jgi:uncharacterized short protein YbdD (DUF466 family)